MSQARHDRIAQKHVDARAEKHREQQMKLIRDRLVAMYGEKTADRMLALAMTQAMDLKIKSGSLPALPDTPTEEKSTAQA